MRRPMRSIGIVVVLTIVLAGCQSTKRETVGETIDDATITATVKTKLAEDRPATLKQIGVETNLRGVKGVREVVNDITIQSNP